MNAVRISAPLAAALIGAISILATIGVGAAFSDATSLFTWSMCAALFLVAGTFCGALYPGASWTLPLLALCGLAIGVFGEAMVMENVYHRSRNLWPLDIAIWSAIAAAPVYLGFAFGKRIRSRS